MENIGTEHIYEHLKSKKIEEKFLAEKSLANQNELKNKNKVKAKSYIIKFPTQYSHFVYNTFTTYINDNYFECPIISEADKWLQLGIDKKPPVELTNLIYQLKYEINYEQYNNIIKANVILKGESKFWIFLHCEDNFNDKTILIILSKKEFSKRCFVSVGTFIDKNINNNNNKNNININSSLNNIERKILYESNTDASKIINISNNNGYQSIDYNIDNNLDNNIDYNNINTNDVNEGNIEYEFVIFKTQELVEEISLKDKLEKNKNNINNMFNDINLNVCYLNINVFDDGINVNAKIKLNDGNYENEIKENFFKSVFNITNNNIISPKCKIMFAGSGECKINCFENEINEKKYKYNKYSNDCQCCSII